MDATAATHSYFARFNDTDMHIRKCTSSSQCQKTYLESLRALSLPEQAILRPHLDHIDGVCRQAGYERLLGIPWKFWVTHDGIENGYPHTHADTIVLPDSFLNSMKNGTTDRDPQAIRETLLHEKLHVYQRLYPIETHRLIIDQWGFEPIGTTIMTSSLPSTLKQNHVRQNPDTNEIVYAYRGTPLQAAYETHAHSLEDIRYQHTMDEIPSAQRDHPFEVMACVLAPLILSSTPTRLTQQDKKGWLSTAKAWTRVYL